MSIEIPAAAHHLLDDPNFAAVATIQPSGQPQLSVIWVKRDGNDVLFSTTVGRRKQRNLARDPRCTVMINPPDAPYSYLEVRGTVTMTETDGRALIDELAQAYLGIDRYVADDGTDNVRV
ncbi:MAG: PPOX class F420-dependent oxidoreductase, partial [Actinomycetia bacterium]|nr:PPOX class F420-dependent oxidoreductase [Actinomycetes bacterium]